MITGVFRIGGDQDRNWYDVIFTPDRPREHGLRNAKMFAHRFTAKQMDEFYALVGKGVDLVKAREPEGLTFTGTVTDEEWDRYSAQ
jgi:hypothetical protein